MTDTSDKAIEALRSDVMSQVGDDVQKMFGHEALFKRSAAMLIALQAERRDAHRLAADMMLRLITLTAIEIAESLDGLGDKAGAKSLAALVSTITKDHGKTIIDGVLAALTPPTEAKP